MTTGQRLYQRVWEVAVGVPGQPGRLWNDIDIVFGIKKSSKKRPNELELQIYNLSPDSRSFMERENSVLILRAGYDSDKPATIFIGDIHDVQVKRDGEETVTTVFCADGSRAFTLATIDEAFAPGITNVELLKSAVSKMGLGLGFIADIDEREYTQGFTASGNVSDLLDEIVGIADAEWSIQDGVLQIVKEDVGTNQTVVVLNEDTGLIGTPERKKTKGKKAKKKVGISAVSLLNPLIRPGSYVRIESEFITGFFLVKSLEHRGDTYSTDWYTSFDATELQASPVIEDYLRLNPGDLEGTSWWTELTSILP